MDPIDVRRRLLGACLLGCVPGSVHALDATVSLAHESEYSSNYRRTGTDESGEWRHEPGVLLGLSHENFRTTATVDYAIFHRMHEESDFDDETVAEGSAALAWRVIPNRLTLDVLHSRRESLIDTRRADTFDNREEVDTTSAGALLSLPGFRSHTLDLSYRVEWGQAETTETDRERRTATAAYVIPLSLTSTLSLVASHAEVDFDAEDAFDYESRTGRVAYSAARRQTTLTAGIGYTKNDRDLPEVDDASGMSGDVDLTYAFSDVTTLNLGYLHHFRDNSLDYGRGLREFGDPLLDPSELNELFVEDTVYVGFTTVVGGTSMSLRADHSSYDYEDVPRDEQQDTVGIYLTRPIRANLTASLYGSFSRVEFEDEREEYDEIRSGLRFGFTPRPRLTLFLGGEYQKREPDGETTVVSGEYDEWNVTLGLTYLLFTTGNPMGGAR